MGYKLGLCALVLVLPALALCQDSAFQNSGKWPIAIQPSAQAWAEEEAQRLAARGHRGYRRNGHPGGANPHANGVTGTGYTTGGGLIPTCEGAGTLVAAAVATAADGTRYGVRSWSRGVARTLRFTTDKQSVCLDGQCVAEGQCVDGQCNRPPVAAQTANSAPLTVSAEPQGGSYRRGGPIVRAVRNLMQRIRNRPRLFGRRR